MDKQNDPNAPGRLDSPDISKGARELGRTPQPAQASPAEKANDRLIKKPSPDLMSSVRPSVTETMGDPTADVSRTLTSPLNKVATRSGLNRILGRQNTDAVRATGNRMDMARRTYREDYTAKASAALGVDTGDSSAVRTAAAASVGQYQFMRTTMTSYMTQSLSTMMRQAAISQDMYSLSHAGFTMLERKMNALIINTAAPDSVKRTVYDIVREAVIRDAATYASRELARTLKTKFGPDFNKYIKDPLKKKTADYFADNNTYGGKARIAAQEAKAAALGYVRRKAGVAEGQDMSTDQFWSGMKTIGLEQADRAGKYAKRRGALGMASDFAMGRYMDPAMKKFMNEEGRASMRKYFADKRDQGKEWLGEKRKNAKFTYFDDMEKRDYIYGQDNRDGGVWETVMPNTKKRSPETLRRYMRMKARRMGADAEDYLRNVGLTDEEKKRKEENPGAWFDQNESVSDTIKRRAAPIIDRQFTKAKDAAGELKSKLVEAVADLEKKATNKDVKNILKSARETLEKTDGSSASKTITELVETIRNSVNMDAAAQVLEQLKSQISKVDPRTKKRPEAGPAPEQLSLDFGSPEPHQSRQTQAPTPGSAAAAAQDAENPQAPDGATTGPMFGGLGDAIRTRWVSSGASDFLRGHYEDTRDFYRTGLSEARQCASDFINEHFGDEEKRKATFDAAKKKASDAWDMSKETMAAWKTSVTEAITESLKGLFKGKDGGSVFEGAISADMTETNDWLKKIHDLTQKYGDSNDAMLQQLLTQGLGGGAGAGGGNASGKRGWIGTSLHATGTAAGFVGKYGLKAALLPGKLWWKGTKGAYNFLTKPRGGITVPSDIAGAQRIDPALFAAGVLIDAQTRQPITSPDQIRGPVINSLTGEEILSWNDIMSGAQVTGGKSILGMMVRGAGTAGMGALKLSGKALGGAKDVGLWAGGKLASGYGMLGRGAFGLGKKALEHGPGMLGAVGTGLGKVAGAAGKAIGGLGSLAGGLAMGGLGLYGKLLSGAWGAAKGVGKWVGGKLWRAGKRALGIRDQSDANETHGVSRRLDDIIDILTDMRKKLIKTRLKNDANGDGIEDGSYQDILRRNKERLTGLKDKAVEKMGQFKDDFKTKGLLSALGGLFKNRSGDEGGEDGGNSGSLWQTIAGSAAGTAALRKWRAFKTGAKDAAMGAGKDLWRLVKRNKKLAAAAGLAAAGYSMFGGSSSANAAELPPDQGMNQSASDATQQAGQMTTFTPSNDNQSPEQTPQGQQPPPENLAATPGGFDPSAAMGTGAAMAGAKVIGGLVSKNGAKAAAKVAGKSLLKKIPGLGIIAGGAFAVNRLMKGDYAGAAGELASGLVSTIPYIGTAASVGIDIWLASREDPLLEMGVYDAMGIRPSDKSDDLIRAIYHLVETPVGGSDSAEYNSTAVAYMVTGLGLPVGDKDATRFVSTWFNAIGKNVSSTLRKFAYGFGSNNKMDPESYTTRIDRSIFKEMYNDDQTSDSLSKIMKQMADTARKSDDPVIQLIMDKGLSLSTFNRWKDNNSKRDAVVAERAAVSSTSGTTTTTDKTTDGGTMATSASGAVSTAAAASTTQGSSSSIGSTISNAWDSTKSAVSSAYDSVKSYASDAYDYAKSKVGGDNVGVDNRFYKAAPDAPAWSGLGSLSQQFESSKDLKKASMSVGYDSTGGTSYGRYQISAKKGTFNSFLAWLDKEGGEAGKSIADELRAAGAPETGSREGAVPDAWRKIAGENRGLSELEHKFIIKTHYDAAFDKLDGNLKDIVGKSRALQDVLVSTAVQHGGYGAGRIFNKTFPESKDLGEWITSIYNYRKTQFQSSTPEVRASVIKRFDQEAPLALAMLKQDGGSSAASGTTGSTTMSSSAADQPTPASGASGTAEAAPQAAAGTAPAVQPMAAASGASGAAPAVPSMTPTSSDGGGGTAPATSAPAPVSTPSSTPTPTAQPASGGMPVSMPELASIDATSKLQLTELQKLVALASSAPQAPKSADPAPTAPQAAQPQVRTSGPQQMASNPASVLVRTLDVSRK